MSCKFDVNGICHHPRLPKVAVDEAVCARCDRYMGPPRGAGDVIHAIARSTGAASIVKAVERVTGKPCGCQKRREQLNNAVPFTEGKIT